VAKSSRAKTLVYPGDLGTHGLIGQRVIADTFYGGGYKPGSPEFEAAIFQSTSDHQFRLLDQLAAYYGISSDDVMTRYALLALRLAKDHVPAFRYGARTKRGRPAKINALGRLMEKYVMGGLGQIGLRPGKKRGRKKSLRLADWQKSLLTAVVEICEREGFKGRGAITQALGDLYKHWAKDEGLSEARLKRRYLRHDRKAISKAKKLFPEIAAKMPS
jgi:hypothetical protein